MTSRIVRYGVRVFLLGVFLAGCLESNPQPSPGGGGLDEADAKGWAWDVAAEADADGNEGAQVCCDENGDCPGESACCTGGSSGLPVCLPEPEAGRCWEDNHCPPGEACVGASFCHCSVDCETTVVLGACYPIAVADCVDEHSCSCVEGGCVDGHGLIYYYPEGAGEFQNDNYDPPQELLDVAVARYECNVCECTSDWKIPQGDEWIDVDVAGFCESLVQQDDACGDCLTTWEWEPGP